jgi:hypothetical protein
MIRVTIELLPHGDETRKRHLGTAIIANDGTGKDTHGNYNIRLSRRGQPDSTWKTGRLTGFQRKRFLVWDLLLLALAATVGQRMFRRVK